MGCMKNYIQKLKENFFVIKDVFGSTFMDLLQAFIEKTYEIGLKGKSDLEMI